MKIYIITKGCYSDYHICNVTADYEKAKRYKEAYSDNWGEACIEVYEDGENGKTTTVGRIILLAIQQK